MLKNLQIAAFNLQYLSRCYIHIFIFTNLQANEQNIKINIKQTQPQYSMPHGR